MNSASLPLSIAMLAFITLPNNCLLFIALVQFCAESLSKNKINATPLLLLVSLSFIIVTFTTLPYLENIRYKSLLVREKGRLDTHTVLLLGGQSTTYFFKWGGPRVEGQKSASPQLTRGSTPTVHRSLQLPRITGPRKCQAQETRRSLPCLFPAFLPSTPLKGPFVPSHNHYYTFCCCFKVTKSCLLLLLSRFSRVRLCATP